MASPWTSKLIKFLGCPCNHVFSANHAYNSLSDVVVHVFGPCPLCASAPSTCWACYADLPVGLSVCTSCWRFEPYYCGCGGCWQQQGEDEKAPPSYEFTFGEEKGGEGVGFT